MNEIDYSIYIGKKVFKLRSSKEPKKFKSGLKFNTVKGIVDHPYINAKAFIFEEDDSIVACKACRFVEERVQTNKSLNSKKKILDNADNVEERQKLIYEWCITGQLLKQELWELINYCKLGISKSQLKKQYKGTEDPELTLG